jgi:hypothetical protein
LAKDFTIAEILRHARCTAAIRRNRSAIPFGERIGELMIIEETVPAKELKLS